MSGRESDYVLDSFALLAYLQYEHGVDLVSELLRDAQQGRVVLSMCLINLGEVLYIVERQRGLLAAQEVIAAIDQLPITIIPPDRSLALAAAHIKARHALSYADAFAAALAESRNASIITGAPEFRSVQTTAKIRWLS